MIVFLLVSTIQRSKKLLHIKTAPVCFRCRYTFYLIIYSALFVSTLPYKEKLPPSFLGALSAFGAEFSADLL